MTSVHCIGEAYASRPCHAVVLSCSKINYFTQPPAYIIGGCASCHPANPRRACRRRPPPTVPVVPQPLVALHAPGCCPESRYLDVTM
ncbi:hypothetical protein EVAR_94440_1 [Eumeta japonica]|uniref:Uncharacterized protein n=1 Tax=Eumeta variegata TaxID=151549 RepID=A0A4C1TQ55_EUMVA|nr:hypothetical protein EVAR_94440_1 [Eumeta japonica]